MSGVFQGVLLLLGGSVVAYFLMQALKPKEAGDGHGHGHGHGHGDHGDHGHH